MVLAQWLTWVYPRRAESVSMPQLVLVLPPLARVSCRYRGADHQSDGESWADARHRYSRQGGLGAAVTVAGSCAAVAASVSVVGAAAVANSDTAADDAAAVAAAVAAFTAELMSCLYLACPWCVRLGPLFRHTRCPDHSSAQQKLRVLFRLSSPFP